MEREYRSSMKVSTRSTIRMLLHRAYFGFMDKLARANQLLLMRLLCKPRILECWDCASVSLALDNTKGFIRSYSQPSHATASR